MQLKLLFSRWTRIAAHFLVGGALAWAIELGVIISSNGQVINTGAAAFFMKMGILMLLVGSTGIGYLLSRRRSPLLRILAVLISPVVLFAFVFLFSSLVVPLRKNSSVWYAQQEAPIGVAVIVSLAFGLLLYRGYKPVLQPA